MDRESRGERGAFQRYKRLAGVRISTSEEFRVSVYRKPKRPRKSGFFEDNYATLTTTTCTERGWVDIHYCSRNYLFLFLFCVAFLGCRS